MEERLALDGYCLSYRTVSSSLLALDCLSTDHLVAMATTITTLHQSLTAAQVEDMGIIAGNLSSSPAVQFSYSKLFWKAMLTLECPIFMLIREYPISLDVFFKYFSEMIPQNTNMHQHVINIVVIRVGQL